MSRQSQAKKARRKKRQSARDEFWIPDRVLEELEIADGLEDFDARLTERGWTFGADTDDGAGVFWIWPDSVAEVDIEAESADATVILLSPEDGGQVAHVVFVGMSDDYQFGLDELFEHIEVIEAYRSGQPQPQFG